MDTLQVKSVLIGQNKLQCVHTSLSAVCLSVHGHLCVCGIIHDSSDRWNIYKWFSESSHRHHSSICVLMLWNLIEKFFKGLGSTAQNPMIIFIIVIHSTTVTLTSSAVWLLKPFSPQGDSCKPWTNQLALWWILHLKQKIWENQRKKKTKRKNERHEIQHWMRNNSTK